MRGLLVATARCCLVCVAPGSFPWLGGYVFFVGRLVLAQQGCGLQCVVEPVFLLSPVVTCVNSALAIYSFCYVICAAAGQACGVGGEGVGEGMGGISVSKSLCWGALFGLRLTWQGAQGFVGKEALFLTLQNVE